MKSVTVATLVPPSLNVSADQDVTAQIKTASAQDVRKSASVPVST